MTKDHRHHSTLTRVAAIAASAAAVAVLPLTAGVAQAAPATAASALPPGVVQLNPAEPCPMATLCLYRDYGDMGPAYGIGAGYSVDLHDLPMAGRDGTAADNVSSWVNNTMSIALLVDEEGLTRPLLPGRHLQEPPQTNDTVDLVVWA